MGGTVPAAVHAPWLIPPNRLLQQEAQTQAQQASAATAAGAGAGAGGSAGAGADVLASVRSPMSLGGAVGGAPILVGGPMDLSQDISMDVSLGQGDPFGDGDDDYGGCGDGADRSVRLALVY